METILVFPCGLPDSVAYAAEARSAGKRVIGASSLRFDPAASHYDDWLYLPYVHEDNFVAELQAAVSGAGITTVYTPHDVVSSVLSDVLPRVMPDVQLHNIFPIAVKTREYRSVRERARQLDVAPGWLPLADPRPRVSGTRLAGLLRLVDTVPGMSDNDKISALIEVFRLAPAGDIVEIGSWWGKSAALLTLLSQHYGLGPVLCVDPWTSDADVIRQGVDALDRSSARLEWDDAFINFQCNLAPIAGGRVNYIRGTSLQAVAQYRPGMVLDTEAFGTTRYGGHIAVLHIDGNHAFDRVNEDVAAWTPHVIPGGIVIVDDYVWAFGDGPKRAGDAFLSANADRIDFSFVMGTALFMALKA